jgi:hypothetical protein
VAAERRPHFLPAAQAELIHAATRYEQEREGLGAEFLRAVDRALGLVVAAPERWPLAPRVSPRRGARRYVLERFPYAVTYRLIGDHELEVVAVAHHKRRPGYWAKR